MQTGGMAVDRRTAQLAAKVARDKLSRKEQQWCDTAPGETGPMTAYFDSVPYTGLAWGPMGETSKGVVETVRGVAQLAARRANHFVGPGPISKTIEAQAARVQRAMLRDLGVVAVRANADLLIARRRHVCGAPPGGSGGAAVHDDRARLRYTRRLSTGPALGSVIWSVGRGAHPWWRVHGLPEPRLR